MQQGLVYMQQHDLHIEQVLQENITTRDTYHNLLSYRSSLLRFYSVFECQRFLALHTKECCVFNIPRGSLSSSSLSAPFLFCRRSRHEGRIQFVCLFPPRRLFLGRLYRHSPYHALLQQPLYPCFNTRSLLSRSCTLHACRAASLRCDGSDAFDKC